jgi:peptidyl-prolyl cis-trans isomerase SurA
MIRCMANCFLALFLLLPAPALAETIDRVSVVVGKDPILKSELEDLVGANKGDLAAHKEALDALIADRLIVNEVKKAGADITPDEVEQTIKGVMKQYNLDKDSFPKALKAQGLSMEDYREQLKKQLYKMRLIQTKIKSRVTISAEDIKNAYAKEYGEDANEFKLHLFHILFKGKDDKAKAEADKAYAKLLAGENFFTLAKTNLRLKKPGTLGDFGVVAKDDLVPEFAGPAFNLDEGKFSIPIRSTDGYHILFAKKRVPVEKIPLEKVEKDLHKQLYEKEVERVFRQYLDELKASAYVETIDVTLKSK